MFELCLHPGARLLWTAFAPFMQMSCFFAETFISPDDVTFIALSPPGPAIPTVLIALRLQPLSFRYFICDESVWLLLDLFHLYALLLLNATNHEDDFFAIFGGHGIDDYSPNRLSIAFFDPQTGDYDDLAMELVGIHPGQMNVREFEYEYQVIVGIPSLSFRRLIVYLHPFGLTVSAEVTHAQVTFYGANEDMEEIVFWQDLEHCIIGGDVSEHPVFLEFSLYTHPLLWASNLSNMVWLLGQSNGSSVMLNFPVRALGNLMFYFS